MALSGAESLVVSSGATHFKLCLLQRLLSSWWSAHGPKCCCRSSLTRTQRYAIYLQGEINTSATRNHKKLLWFAFHSKVSTQSRCMFQVCTVFQETWTKFFKNWVASWLVRKTKQTNKQIKHIPKKVEGYGRRKSLVAKSTSWISGFCLQYTSPHNIHFQELETSSDVCREK